MLKTVFLLLFLNIHPVHVSLTSIEYSAKENRFYVFVKLYYNDFVLDYRNSIDDDQNFNPSGKIDTSVVMLDKYFNKKVQIFTDDKKLEARLMNFSSDNGELKMNFLIHCKAGADSVRVKNQILTSLYKDQSNLLIFKYAGFEEGVKMTPFMNERTFKIN